MSGSTGERETGDETLEGVAGRLVEAVEQAVSGAPSGSDPLEPSEEALRDGYKEARADARAFIDLRFKHFTTFAVILGIGTLAASRSELQQERPGIAAVMLAVILLFWSIDGRTAQYHRGVSARVSRYEEALRLPQPPPTPGRRRLPSSTATSLLFLLALLVWTSVLLVHLLRSGSAPLGPSSPTPSSSTVTPVVPPAPQFPPPVSGGPTSRGGP